MKIKGKIIMKCVVLFEMINKYKVNKLNKKILFNIYFNL